MKVVILAGGMGTRLAEETEVKPKPMVEIGGQPILWHIMKHFAHHGHREFFVALGYKGDVIKRYFIDRATLSGSMTVDLAKGHVERHPHENDDWKVHLVETGMSSLTGGRLKRLENMLGNEPFLFTYGDGVSDVDLGALIKLHKKHGKMVTVTAVRPPARFGGFEFDAAGEVVTRFLEKPQLGEGWINGGFMICEPGVFPLLQGDASIFETDALERLSEKGQLVAYRHPGFWQCMDTLRDKRQLEGMWQSGEAPWRVWE